MAAKKQKKKKATKQTKGSFKTKLKFFLFIAAAVVLLKQTVIMVMIAMLPSVVAYIVDDTRSRAWSKAVTACNLAGLLPFLATLYLEKGNSTVAMQQQMSDFFMWLVVYGSAGVAWLLIWGMPMVALSFYRIFYAYRIEEHKKALRKLRSEWGIDNETTAES